MKNSWILMVFVFTLLFSCTKQKNTTSETNTPAKVERKSAQVFSPIPIDKLIMLQEKCDYTDYIFHDLPFAMSQGEKMAILQNLNFIGQNAQNTIPEGCKPMARQMFHVGGDIVMELDVYYSTGCAFYTLIENEKPLYANQMTLSGINFFKEMIDRALQARPNTNQ